MITKIILITNKRMTGVAITKMVKIITMPIAMRMRMIITTMLQVAVVILNMCK